MQNQKKKKKKKYTCYDQIDIETFWKHLKEKVFF